MQNLIFKTNIKCSGCVATVTPVLDRLAGKENWNVKIDSPDKVLTVTGTEASDETRIINELASVGYKAERLK